MTYTIHLCPEAWNLFDAYLAGSATWRAYLRHRRTCGECSKPKKKGE